MLKYLSVSILLLVLAGCFEVQLNKVKLGALYLRGGPSQSFSEDTTPPDTNYSDLTFWASHPLKHDAADIQIIKQNRSNIAKHIDVFFIHPTSYFGRSWIAPVTFDTPTAHNTDWYLRNQASLFNVCCNVYAPHYRQASFYTYVRYWNNNSAKDKILNYAYKDVLNSFKYFISKFNKGKPFIIASHSQGSHHAFKLLAEEIDKDPNLSDRLVVAYTLGSVDFRTWHKEYFDSLDNLTPCATADQINCIVHWNTVAQGQVPIKNKANILCVNPLNWQINGGFMEEEHHQGSLVPLGNFQLPTFWDPNGQQLKSDKFEGKAQLINQLINARCFGDTLFVSDIGEDFEVSEEARIYASGNYHFLDFSLFYLDIQENAKHRISAYKNTKKL